MRSDLDPCPGRGKSHPAQAPDGPIRLLGVTTNNLQNIDVGILFGRLTVITGVSGSGKSSLAFDTLFAESLQKFIESFSPYVRSLINKGGRPDVASTWGLTPPIAIGQKAAARHPRSTVGTMTEIYDYYRLLFAGRDRVPRARGGRLTARMFSFNHEQGACEQCKGLGWLTVCNPESLVTDPDKTLLSGAFDGTKTGRFYGEPHGQYVAALQAAGKALGIDFTVAYERLDEDARRIAMFGTGGHIYDIVWAYKRKNRSGEFKFKGPWKGFANLVNEEYERKHADDRGEAMLALLWKRFGARPAAAALKPRLCPSGTWV